MTDHDRPPGPEGDPIAETIARVRELDAAATKGPWFPGHNPDYLEPLDYIAEAYSCGPSGKVHLTCVPFGDKPIDDEALFTAITGNGPTSEQNAALIAHYRTAAPLLATALEAAMAENERLGAELEMIRDAAADAIRDNEHVGFTVRTLHALRTIKL